MPLHRPNLGAFGSFPDTFPIGSDQNRSVWSWPPVTIHVRLPKSRGTGSVPHGQAWNATSGDRPLATVPIPVDRQRPPAACRPERIVRAVLALVRRRVSSNRRWPGRATHRASLDPDAFPSQPWRVGDPAKLVTHPAAELTSTSAAKVAVRFESPSCSRLSAYDPASLRALLTIRRRYS